jgi:hypothetical protein
VELPQRVMKTLQLLPVMLPTINVYVELLGKILLDVQYPVKHVKTGCACVALPQLAQAHLSQLLRVMLLEISVFVERLAYQTLDVL